MIQKLITAVFCLLFASVIFAQPAHVNIIPQPQTVQLEIHSSGFVITRKTKIVIESESARQAADTLNDALRRNYGFNLVVTTKKQKENAINLGAAAVEQSNPEAYSYRSYPIAVWLGGGPRGLFYAVQTLLQLITVNRDGSLRLPKVDISDAPRFGYRGMHLDVGRHFMPVEFVKKYIDLMSQYKFNYFHWHLTEDQGWRIEIKKYPKLTEIGSKRKETVMERNLTPYIGDGIPVEGFYTQEEIKAVVAYAKARYITVIPEIELPGHASAALAAYPQFGCKQDYQYKVQTTWGIFKEVYCPTDETFKFLEDILDETIALFPDSPYIHIGGDEVLKDHWKESAFVQELKKREDLKDEHEVQSYFVRRIEKYINSKGKKMIGWDEILEGGLAPNATVMSWRGIKGGIEAAKAKHDVIMTPTDFVYFDYGQGDPAYEPINIGGYLTMEKVYSFDPVPKELSADEAKYIIGGQGNVWTEYMKTPAAVEYMAFPRMLALSEVLWSRPEDKNFADFSRRLYLQFPRLDKQNVNYRIPEPFGLRNIVTADERVLVDLQPHVRVREIFYTTDGSTPIEGSPVYYRPMELGLKEGEVKTLKTVVMNAAGRLSSVYTATYLRRDYLQPVDLTDKRPGVTYAFLVPAAAAAAAPLITSGETKSIGLQQFAKASDLKQAFSVTFDGYINIPANGIYEFQVDSTWDTTIVLGGEKSINDLGTKDRTVKSAVVPLRAGLHKISLRYNHRGGDAAFRIGWGIKGQGLRQIGGGELFH